MSFVNAYVIPTRNDEAEYTIRTHLDGKDYNLHFLWNQREGRWYLDVLDDAENMLAANVKLIANWPLLRYRQFDPNVPPGELMVVDLSDDGSPPGITELAEGQRCQLVYYSATDL